MRLHHLAITAFGPFAGSEQIDLDALASSGLFLVHGPTGAGKTSILDAICFALYAAVPGARAGARASLRSDHSAAGVVPEVTLEFTAAGRRLRVCRSPEFSRPKKRGTGERTVPATVSLSEYTEGAWACLGTRNDEVALVLKDILGMGLEQFITVVLLPQGDFAAFLRASPEERRSVLEKLFDTRRFTDVEAWLTERRRRTAAVVVTARGELSTGLMRVGDVLTHLDEGPDICVPVWSELPHGEVDAALRVLADAVDTRASTALAEVEVARARVTRTESAVHLGVAVAGNQETAAGARDRLASLKDQRGAYESARHDVDLAERAGGVSGFMAAADSAGLLLEAVRGGIAELRASLAVVADLDPDEGTVTSLIDKVARHSEALQQGATHAANARSLDLESARHARAALADEEALMALSRQRKEAENRRTVAERSRDVGRSAASEIPALEARLTSLSRIQRLLGEQQQSADELESLQRQADSAGSVLLDARELLLDLRERRLAGMAAELAGRLQTGDPCPVCGSCAHPRPATTSDVVSLDDIRSAEGEVTHTTESVSRFRSLVSAELARVEARALELARQRPITAAADVPVALVAAEAAVIKARTAASALPAVEAQVVALSLEVERLRDLIEHANADKASSLALAASTRAQCQNAGAEVATLLAAHEGSCPCAPAVRRHRAEGTDLTKITNGSQTTDRSDVVAQSEVEEVIASHAHALVQLRSLATGLREAAIHEASAHDAGLRLRTVLQDSGFETREQAASAALPQARVAELTAFVRAVEQHRAEATALLAQPDVTAALTQPVPDLAALAQEHTLAAVSLTDAGRRHTLAEQAQRDLRSLGGTVHQAVAGLGPAEEEARLVLELADCVAGNSADNALRMRLSSYVLAARLAEIATLANERLGTMSDGRYTLEYTDARAARGARSGLGLLVRDAWTGRSRETSSLSGGESFMASLALALGLGDAVRAEAGGLDLQTLFVDEGFGSLDEESLEQVMAVLDTLREGGRAVGIVSHVSELRQRIPHQLHVVKAQVGSHISVDSPAVLVT